MRDGQSSTKVRQPRSIRPLAVPPAIFAHFVIQTANLVPMRDWYRTVLDAEIVFEDSRLCFLTYDDEHHRLALVIVPGLQARSAQSAGVHHVAYGYRALEELLGTYVRLKNVGIVPYRSINHGPTVSLYYHDPDGLSVELQVDAFASKEEAAAFFLSEAFRENPIGVTFEPDEMVAAFDAGISEAELKRRAATGRWLA